MKRILISIIIALLVPVMLFSAESFFILDATDWVQGSGSYYRYSFQSVMKLSDVFEQPNYSQSDYQNKLSSANAIAAVGVAGVSHNIKYTFDTHGGKFVSQSDPSKYRSYYIVASPDYSSSNSGNISRSYYKFDVVNNQGISDSTMLPNTKNSPTMTYVTPKTDGTSQRVSTSNTKYNIYSFGLDLFIIMEELSNADLTHVAENDDYIATITISWECYNNNCTGNHSGSFDIMIRGYYGNNSGLDTDTFFVVIEPTSNALSLNLKDMLINNETKEIANLIINTTTRRIANDAPDPYEWRNHLYAFLSASPNYNSSSQKFLFRNNLDPSVTIPYTLTVYNKSNQNVYSTFDGLDYFTSTNSNSGNFLDLKDYSKPSTDYYSKFTDRFGQSYYAINYSASVKLTLVDKEVSVNGTNVPLSTILSNTNTYSSKYSTYVGQYSSNIYYHVVYVD
ncbi:MAG: hypothetical protein J5599_09550 [Spirochaetales bacterium]|nr:hypothetical protein [Spirochaetales bacterium]